MLVVDASAFADLLLDLRRSEQVRRYIAEYRWEIHAPHLLDLEILSSLRRAVAAGKMSEGRAAAAVIDLLSFSVERYPNAILGARIWQLKENFTPYDAAYLALAENLSDRGVPLLTTDARFARAARRHTDVEVLLAA
jgi:predicted nucleic acid-binding protein